MPGPFNLDGEPMMTDAQYRLANELDSEPDPDEYYDLYNDDERDDDMQSLEDDVDDEDPYDGCGCGHPDCGAC